MKYEEEFKSLLETWGEESQHTLAIEEMSELTKELCKLQRYKNSEDKEKVSKIKENIIEEIADVLIVVKQLARIYGEEKVDEIREQKIKRAMDGVAKIKNKNLG